MNLKFEYVELDVIKISHKQCVIHRDQNVLIHELNGRLSMARRSVLGENLPEIWPGNESATKPVATQ